MDNQALIKKAEQTHRLSKDEIVYLLKTEAAQQSLIDAANRVRHCFVGDEVHLRALIEFSNRCQCNCMYCGLRRDNKQIERYHLSLKEIVDFASYAKTIGYKTIVLQSGESGCIAPDEFAAILRAIKAMDLAITLSIGEKSYEEYKLYRDAGADRYLLRIETTDKALYAQLHPQMSFDNRRRCLRDLKSLGYEVGTGCLIGLPNQRIDSLADDILFFQSIDADMLGIGPFIPNQDTPLSDAAGGSLDLTLRFIALLRLLMPDINIPATTALETLAPGARWLALAAGANVVMPNVTQGDYRSKYALYPGKALVQDTPEQYKAFIAEKISGAGRTISSGYGYRCRR